MTRKVCPVRLADRLFFLCAGAYIIGLFGRLNFAAVMAQLIAEGLTKSQAGLIGTAMFVVYGVCQLLSGMVGDHVAPRRMITLGVLGSGICNLVMAFSGAFGLMLIVWAINGVFQSLIWSPCARVFSEMMPPTHRIRACSNASATYPIATVLVYLAVSLLLRFTGARAIFAVAGALMIPTALAFNYRMRYFEAETDKNGQTETIAAQAMARSGDSLGRLLFASGISCALIGVFSLGLLRDGIQAWIPTFLVDSFHFGASASVAAAILLPLLSLAGVALTRYMTKKYIRNEFSGAIGFFLAVLAALVVLFLTATRSAPLAIASMTAASMLTVGANTMFINLAPIRFGAFGRSSSITGLLNCVAYTGSAASSYGIGLVAERFGWHAAIGCWIGCTVLSILGCLVGRARWGRFSKETKE